MDDPEVSAELAKLCADFPRHDISAVTILDRRRYTAQRRDPGVRPYLVVTDDLGELRAVLSEGRRGPAPSKPRAAGRLSRAGCTGSTGLS